MIGAVYGIGLTFGFLAGLYFGLPAFVAGLLIALIAVVGLGVGAEQGFPEIANRALILAVTLQVSYVLGLCAQAVFAPLRKQTKQQEKHGRKPSARKVE